MTPAGGGGGHRAAGEGVCSGLWSRAPELGGIACLWTAQPLDVTAPGSGGTLDGQLAVPEVPLGGLAPEGIFRPHSSDLGSKSSCLKGNLGSALENAARAPCCTAPGRVGKTSFLFHLWSSSPGLRACLLPRRPACSLALH